MIVVNSPGNEKTTFAPLLHAPWNGCTPTDWIFPFFLFVVGVSMALSLPRRKAAGESDGKIMLHVFRRSLILFAMGVIYNSFPFTKFDLATFRIPGVLQRIAVCYFFAALIFLRSGTRGRVVATAVLLLGYWAVMTWVPVPGHGPAVLTEKVKDGNLGAHIDRLLLGRHLSSKTWDGTGLFGCWPGVANVLLGVLAGQALLAAASPGGAIRGLIGAGALSVAVGWLWGGGPGLSGLLTLGEPRWQTLVFAINKPLWTSSYVLYTCGLAAIGMALCYWLVDVRRWKAWTFPFTVFGMNAVLAFFLSGLLKRSLASITVESAEGGRGSLHAFLFTKCFLPWADPFVASLFYALTALLLWLGIMAVLHRKKLFLKL